VFHQCFTISNYVKQNRFIPDKFYQSIIFLIITLCGIIPIEPNYKMRFIEREAILTLMTGRGEKVLHFLRDFRVPFLRVVSAQPLRNSFVARVELTRRGELRVEILGRALNKLLDIKNAA
jgi:hypothetical protein